MENTTERFPNITGNARSFNIPDLMRFYGYQVGFLAVFILVGIVLNSWIFLAIVTDKKLRSRLRNQLICSLCLANFLEIVSTQSLRLFELCFALSFQKIYVRNCEHTFTYRTLYFYFISVIAWTLVTIVALYLSSNAGCSKTKNQNTARNQRIGKWMLLLWSWIVPGIVVSILVHVVPAETRRPSACRGMSSFSYLALRALDGPVALSILVTLLILAIIFNRIKFGGFSGTHAGNNSDVRMERMQRTPEVDSPWAYLLAVFIALASDAIMLILIFHSFALYSISSLKLATASRILTSAAIAFLPLPWLLLPDVRARCKSWRPWRCQSSDTDEELIVAYSQESQQI